MSPTINVERQRVQPALVRIATTGSVDDGKSTLIGRLLYDSGQIQDDQLEHVVRTSADRGDGYVDLALLTDGLRAEREQGITIDVAYRYFHTHGRKFILADTPGHEQYTRNMATGASTADVALMLIDARKGVLQQSHRHAFIASLLRVPNLLVCVNKMDLVDYDEQTCRAIFDQFLAWVEPLEFDDIALIPIAALQGDNIVNRSEKMAWYEGPTVLEYLLELDLSTKHNSTASRFPVQFVIRPMSQEHHDYRGYAGQVASGVFRVDDEVVVLPSGARTRIAAVDSFDGDLDSVGPGASVTLQLADQVDVSRGDMICSIDEQPTVTRDLTAVICWMTEKPLRLPARYRIKHTTRTAVAQITEIEHRFDVTTLGCDQGVSELGCNDIGQVRLRLSEPLVVDDYSHNRVTGSFILIDEATGDTVAAGMINKARG